MLVFPLGDSEKDFSGIISVVQGMLALQIFNELMTGVDFTVCLAVVQMVLLLVR